MYRLVYRLVYMYMYMCWLYTDRHMHKLCKMLDIVCSDKGLPTKDSCILFHYSYKPTRTYIAPYIPCTVYMYQCTFKHVHTYMYVTHTSCSSPSPPTICREGLYMYVRSNMCTHTSCSSPSPPTICIEGLYVCSNMCTHTSRSSPSPPTICREGLYVRSNMCTHTSCSSSLPPTDCKRGCMYMPEQH